MAQHKIKSVFQQVEISGDEASDSRLAAGRYDVFVGGFVLRNCPVKMVKYRTHPPCHTVQIDVAGPDFGLWKIVSHESQRPNGFVLRIEGSGIMLLIHATRVRRFVKLVVESRGRKIEASTSCSIIANGDVVVVAGRLLWSQIVDRDLHVFVEALGSMELAVWHALAAGKEVSLIIDSRTAPSTATSSGS